MEPGRWRKNIPNFLHDSPRAAVGFQLASDEEDEEGRRNWEIWEKNTWTCNDAVPWSPDVGKKMRPILIYPSPQLVQELD